MVEIFIDLITYFLIIIAFDLTQTLLFFKLLIFFLNINHINTGSKKVIIAIIFLIILTIILIFILILFLIQNTRH